MKALIEHIDTFLLEQVLMSELTVGFELEGYYPNHIHDLVYDEMKNYGMTVYRDASVKSPPDHTPFEADMGYGPIKPRWMKKIVNRLENLFELGVRTNDSCGFHSHFGFGNLRKKPRKASKIENALLVYELVERGTLEEFSSFRGIPQFSKGYADIQMAEDFAFDINGVVEAYQYEKLDRSAFLEKLLGIIDKYTEHKFTVFRVHDSGTLEWRGLRGVLKDDMDWTRKLIKEYIYKHVYKFGSEVASILSDISSGELWYKTGVTKRALIEYGDAEVISRRARKVGLKALEKTYPSIVDKLSDMKSGDEEVLVSALYESRELLFPLVESIKNPSEATLIAKGSKRDPVVIFENTHFHDDKLISIYTGTDITIKFGSGCNFEEYLFEVDEMGSTHLFEECDFTNCIFSVVAGSDSEQRFNKFPEKYREDIAMANLLENLHGLKDVTIRNSVIKLNRVTVDVQEFSIGEDIDVSRNNSWASEYLSPRMKGFDEAIEGSLRKHERIFDVLRETNQPSNAEIDFWGKSFRLVLRDMDLEFDSAPAQKLPGGNWKPAKRDSVELYYPHSKPSIVFSGCHISDVDFLVFKAPANQIMRFLDCDFTNTGFQLTRDDGKQSRIARFFERDLERKNVDIDELISPYGVKDINLISAVAEAMGSDNPPNWVGWMRDRIKKLVVHEYDIISSTFNDCVLIARVGANEWRIGLDG